MNITKDIKTTITQILCDHDINADCDQAIEIWMRHLDDEAEFLYSHDKEMHQVTTQFLLEWIMEKAQDYAEGGVVEATRQERLMANKLMFSIWLKGKHKGTSFEHFAWEEYKLIDNAIAKTLPEGHEEVCTTYNSKSGRNVTTVRHIKGGKWHKGHYQK